MSRCLRVDAAAPDPAVIAEAARTLGLGRLVVTPTDTVYGLAADPRCAGAVERIYRAKGRPAEKELVRLADTFGQVVDAGALFTPLAERLARRFWPGALTLVLPLGGDWCGFRVPDHAVCRALVRAAGAPLAVTSANRSGAQPARRAAEAVAALGDDVALVLDAGPAPGGVPSTVVRVDGERLEILREGAISEPALRSAAGEPGT